MLLIRLKLIGMTLLPIALLILPKDYFNSGRSWCLFTLLSGYHCPGCGLTRACMHLIHLDFAQAWSFNKFSFVVFPILAFFYTKEWLENLKKIRKN